MMIRNFIAQVPLSMIHVCGEETVDSSDSFWHFDAQGQLIQVKHL
jgi:hypothetical protein